MISKKKEHIVYSGQWLGSKKAGNSRDFDCNTADSKRASELKKNLLPLQR